jgi:FKBP-type peptidyl-prolyl cis-trans isomerase
MWQIRVQFAASNYQSRSYLEALMSKSALREQRRAQRIARRNRQRAIIGVIVVLALVAIAILVYRDYASRAQATSTSTANATPTPGLDATAPAPSANAITTADGLIYEDLQVGTGATAQTGDTVSVYYTGWLADGTKFDSSLDRGQTLDFTLGAGKVIAGWDEGVVGMKVGGIRLLVIPPSLGYGATQYSSIPGNSTLTFEVQLAAIQ